MDQPFLFDLADIPETAEPWRLHSLDENDTSADITPLPDTTTQKDAA